MIIGSLAAVVVSAVPFAPPAMATAAEDQLRAHRAELVVQLQQLLGQRSGASTQLLSAEQALTDIQNRLAAARKRLDGADARLMTLSRQIADDEHVVSSARTQLRNLVRATYESTSSDGFVAAILSANDFGQAMDRMKGAAHVTDQVKQLQARLQTRQAALTQERAALQKNFTEARALEGQLSDDSNKLLVLVAQRNTAYKNVDGPARAVAAQISDIDLQLAGNTSPGPTVASSSPCGNHFAYGYCTYYVASRRCIPWFGNAWEWWGNAPAYGYAEGHVPQRGAVAVWGRGGSSPDGHVAYVEAVGPDNGVPPGHFLISEMNYNGWNRVNQRVVANNAPGLLGFIYGHV
ncbi:MAG TPA: CHAP domain-containing protein [Candidatus Dormibacteraeota bacterium]|nr:CHAP domain-containing protein [Candidatus Dormibacteraeota bacterium]